MDKFESEEITKALKNMKEEETEMTNTNIDNELAEIKALQEKIVDKILMGAKHVDGTYKSAAKHIQRSSEIYLYKNNQDALWFYKKAHNQLQQDIEAEIDLLKDKKLF